MYLQRPCVKFFAIFVLVGLDFAFADLGAYLRCYKGTINNYDAFDLQNGEDILNSECYNPEKDTAFYTYGFMGKSNGPATIAVLEALMATNSYNVILLDWEKLAVQENKPIPVAYLNVATRSANKVAQVFGDVLLKMFEQQMDSRKVRFIGHSLGAQVFGMTGGYLLKKGVKLPWITGLDPASIGFENASGASNLNRRSAQYVEIIHSDPNKYGYRSPHGTVDYWPNFESRNFQQPGCAAGNYPPFSAEDMCNHNRSWMYFVDAIRRPKSLVAVRAKNYNTWKNFKIGQNLSDILYPGFNPLTSQSGNYYFTTNENSPFGKGLAGIFAL